MNQVNPCAHQIQEAHQKKNATRISFSLRKKIKFKCLNSILLLFQSWIFSILLPLESLNRNRITFIDSLWMKRISEWLWKIRAPHPDCSGKLKEVSSSVWAAARWGWLYYISIHFPQRLSNFSQGRLMACWVSDNLKLYGGHLYRIHRDYEFYVLRKWTVCPNATSQHLRCSLGSERSGSEHISKPACKTKLPNHLRFELFEPRVL